MDGPSFRAHVEQFVVPIPRQGDIVVMDNLPSHKVAGIREAIEAAGAELRYPPSCSSDFNPIEQFFAKCKALLRKVAGWGRLVRSHGSPSCSLVKLTDQELAPRPSAPPRRDRDLQSLSYRRRTERDTCAVPRNDLPGASAPKARLQDRIH